jgi:hypothetical protein
MLALSFALGVALAWVPILIKFFRSWRARSNPISLAICLLIGLAGYVPVYVAVMFASASIWSIATVIGTDGIICFGFHGAVMWSAKRFPDTRYTNGVR